MNWLRRVFGRYRLERELDKELADHIQRRIADKVAKGIEPAEAARQARIEFGGMDQIKEVCRDVRGTRWIENLVQDCRYGLRTMAANKVFSVLAVLSLALGIGACTAIFTVLNAVILRPLPYSNPTSLVQLWELSDKGRNMRLPEPNFVDWKVQSRSFEDMAIFNGAIQPIAGGTEPTRARVSEVSRGFFEILRVPAMFGTTFRPEHLQPSTPPTNCGELWVVAACPEW